MSFFDPPVPKYDPQKGPMQSAAEYLRPKLSEWNEGDEWLLTPALQLEPSKGWGGLDELGVICGNGQRALASYSISKDIITHSFSNKFSVQLLVCTTKEAFSYFADQHRAIVYYGNEEIGFITPRFSIVNTQGLKVVQLYPQSRYIVDNFNAPILPVDFVNGIAPTSFQLYTGLSGWFNVPPPNILFPVYGQLPFVRAMALQKGQHLPSSQERMWILAAYFFLRLGAYSRVAFPPEQVDGFWDVINNLA